MRRLRPLHDLHSRRKKKVEEYLDVTEQFGGYHHYFPDRPTYEQFVGIKLCCDRPHLRRTATAAIAYGIAMSTNGVTPTTAHYEALYDDPEQAQAQRQRDLVANQQRQELFTKAQQGRRPSHMRR